MADNVNSSIIQHQTGTAFINGKCLNNEKQRTEMPPHKIGFTIQSTNCISTWDTFSRRWILNVALKIVLKNKMPR